MFATTCCSQCGERERANGSKGRPEEEIHIHEQSQRDHDVPLYSRCHDLTTFFCTNLLFLKLNKSDFV